MKQIRQIVLILSVGLMTACSGEGNQTAQEAEVLLSEFAENYPALSVSIYQADELLWTYNHSKAGDIAITEDTKFNSYSTAKGLTGLAFMPFINNGTLSLTDKVGDIAPDLPEVFHAITIKDLLSHRSGIRHYSSPLDWLGYAQMRCETPQDGIAYFAGDSLLFEPGTKEHYSSFAYVLASALLNRLSETDDFETALNTSLGGGAEIELDSLDAQKAQPLIKAGILPQLPPGVDPEAIIPMPKLSNECKFGAGGLVMSSKQLAQAGALLFEEDRAKLLMNWPDSSTNRYGAAYSENNGRWQLSGGAPGGRSYLLVSLNARLSIALTGNFDGPHMGEVANKLADLWENKD